MNGRFVEMIVEEAKRLNEKKKLKLEFTITTNATLIDRYLDLLVDNQFKMLISLDGDEKGQGYRTFMKDGTNSFWQAIRNIDRLQCEYPDFSEKGLILMRCCTIGILCRRFMSSFITDTIRFLQLLR